MAALSLDRLGRAQRDALRAVLAAAPRGSAPVLVGGAVRDAWLARAARFGTADLDLAVPAGALGPARALAARLARALVRRDPRRGPAPVVRGGAVPGAAAARRGEGAAAARRARPPLRDRARGGAHARHRPARAPPLSRPRALASRRGGRRPRARPHGRAPALRRGARPPHGGGAPRRRHAWPGPETRPPAARRGAARDPAP